MDAVYGPISPTIALGLMIALTVSAAVICIYRGMKTKNNIFYISSGLFCFMAFSCLIGILGHPFLFIIMFIISCVASLFVSPKIWRINAQINAEKLAKAQETVDASEPIRLKEIFSASLLIKLERKYGERKAMLITFIGGAAIASPVLVAMVLLHVATWYHVIVWGVGFGFIFYLIAYRQMKKELQRMKEDRST